MFGEHQLHLLTGDRHQGRTGLLTRFRSHRRFQSVPIVKVQFVDQMQLGRRGIQAAIDSADGNTTQPGHALGPGHELLAPAAFELDYIRWLVEENNQFMQSGARSYPGTGGSLQLHNSFD